MNQKYFLNKYLLLFILAVFFSFKVFSQDNKTDSIKTEESGYKIFMPNMVLCDQLKNELRVINALIKLRVHPYINLKGDQYNQYLSLVDTIEMSDNVIIKDTVSITLKSGISWNLTGDPPPQPRRFYVKARTKKGREEEAVINRLKYLQFCYEFKKENQLPYEMVEKFNSYYAVIVDEKIRCEMLYEIRFNPEGTTKTTSKEIRFF